MSSRVVRMVREVLGARLRALRKERMLSQERLGKRSGLSGKFIGEVERREKSISIDSLYRVAVALNVPLRELTDIGRDRQSAGVREEAERVRAIVVGRTEGELSRAHKMLKIVFAGRTRPPARKR